ncbi:hypothetical protein ACJX0J_024825, partial [Zea mays]
TNARAANVYVVLFYNLVVDVFISSRKRISSNFYQGMAFRVDGVYPFMYCHMPFLESARVESADAEEEDEEDGMTITFNPTTSKRKYMILVSFFNIDVLEIWSSHKKYQKTAPKKNI